MLEGGYILLKKNTEYSWLKGISSRDGSWVVVLCLVRWAGLIEKVKSEQGLEGES